MRDSMKLGILLSIAVVCLCFFSAGCGKKEEKPQVVVPQNTAPAELPVLAQNFPGGNLEASREPDYSFQESPNKGLEEISEADRDILIEKTD